MRNNSQVFFKTLILTFTLFALTAISVFAQGTGATGTIQGSVTDPSGAVIPGAKVEITSKATGRTLTLTTSGSGFYSSGALIPGDYTITANAPGFSPVNVPVPVQVNVTSNGNVKMGITAAEQVTVEAQGIRINTEQATVQGVVTTEQIETLPFNGRNFMELAQLEPGVQIQDGSNFDPTKGGFSGISIGGRSGRTTRIELDGQDITDETVGATVSNVAAGGIQEFDLAQSSLDPSSELTSSGAVNVASRTGTNAFHGEAFYLFRDKSLAANPPGGIQTPYQRNHFGGRFGGPIAPSKLFFFVTGERIKQDIGVPVSFSPPSPFVSSSGVASEPFREKEGLARLDWQATSNAHVFYRINYDNLSAASNSLIDFSVYKNLNNTPAQAAGIDFTTGNWTHSIRYGYLKFQNHISDATVGSGLPVLFPGAQVRVTPFRSGSNPLAPQATFQSNNQIKYDGSTLWGSHSIRFGAGYNKILGGGFANFFGLAPSIRSTTRADRVAFAAAGPFAGGAANPLNYPISQIVLGNGQGFNTETPQFGYPAGGQYDNRIQFYLADTWKIRPNFTLTASVRYVRDTGRTNSDLAPIPCSAVDPTLFSPLPCTGDTPLLDQFGQAGLGKRVRQDNNNIGPSIGFVWDPTGTGQTVIRAGAGVYYENAIFNNVLFSRPLMLQKGLFNNTPVICGGTSSVQFPNGPVTMTPSGKDIGTQICGQAIGSVAADVIGLQNALIAATAAAGAGLNPSFVGETLNPSGLLAPNYRSPFSYQMNIGVQRQVWRGAVLSADYIRNINLHYLLGIDTNHVGDVRYFNKAAAINGINATNASFGCPAGVAGIDCSIAAGATMDDFAGNGVGPGSAVCGGPCTAFGLTPDQGAAFAGINPLVGSNVMYFPIGRSVYNALQLSLRSTSTDPFTTLHMLKKLNFQASYSFSKFASGTNGDQDFIGGGFDYNNPNRYLGWSEFDRTHQISIGTTLELPKALQFSLITHINSPLSSSLWSPSTGGAADIFVTDFTGDGTTQDPLPGTVNGSYGRDIKRGFLDSFLNNYNNTVAGTATPAGQVLINQGLFTLAQLQSLGGVAQQIAVPTGDPARNGWLKVVDFKTSFPFHIGEHFIIEPSASIYNLFNFKNLDVSPTTRLSSILDGSAGSVNGTLASDARNAERATQTSSTFGLGAPRQIEFGLRITF